MHKKIFTKLITEDNFVPYTFVDNKISWNSPYRFESTKAFPEGQMRPKCINDGCSNPVGYTSTSNSGMRILRTVCTTCHRKKDIAAPGVKIFKKSYCENNNGMLGFPCTSTIHYSGVLELDHIDGNHYHNLQHNVQTLCKICHSYKGYLEKNFS